MEHIIAEIARKTREEFDSHFTKRWEEMSVGNFLCIHERMKGDPSGDDFKMIFEVTSHILQKNEECGLDGKRILIGPKGE